MTRSHGGTEKEKKNHAGTGKNEETVSETEKTAAVKDKFSDIEKQNALNKVTDYYHKTLQSHEQAQAYLEKRGIFVKPFVDQFKIGFCNRSIQKLLGKKHRELLMSTGILRDNQTRSEHFSGCLTFPVFDDQDNCVNMIGRRIRNRQSEGSPNHLFLKGAHRGVFNEKALNVYDTAILTECPIDSLSLMILGHANTVPLYGANGLTDDHINAFRKHETKLIILGLDNDAEGRAGADRAKDRLLNEGFPVKIIFPPKGKDWNDFLLADPDPKDIDIAIDNAETHHPPAKEPLSAKASSNLEETLADNDSKFPFE
ncbi:MAG: toprim domain-containing protein, partial [Chloroflexi bacterium]|nr:toprim domain-containing protein [Chloroflexota bacterium]